MLYVWERVVIDPKGYSINTVNDLLNKMDEEYGDPDGDRYSEPTEKMKQAEMEFIKVVLSEYVPWSCEQTCEEEIDVKGWVRKNRPDWLEPFDELGKDPII